MELKKPDIRYLNNMKEVLCDQEWAKDAPNLELYYMYRYTKRDGALRYDITEIPFQMLGKEYVKTKGHSHAGAETYEVLQGKAIFLLQKCNEKKPDEKTSRQVEDVYAVEVKSGDKVFIPAHYGHVTINPGPEDLKMANWVSDAFKSDYSLYLEKQGACYYCIKGNRPPSLCKSEGVNWIKNENYGKVPELRFEKPNKNIPEDLKKALMGE